MARDPHGRWRVVPREEGWPGFAPFARAPREPFESGADVEGARTSCGSERANGEASAWPAQGSGDRGGPSPAPDEADRTHRLLGALFDQASAEPGFGQSRDLRQEAGAEAEPTAGHREPAKGRGEAEMFAIAFACCKEMLFRLSDQFARQVPSVRQSEDASRGNR